MIWGCRRSQPGTLRGYALITSLVFLAILTMVGLFTLRNTALETMMSANNNKNAQAFEAAEATRRMVSQMIEPHIRNRGWPQSVGGMIDDDRFGVAMPTGIVLIKNPNSTGPRHWYDDVPRTSSNFNPLDLSKVDARYSHDLLEDETSGFNLQGITAVRILRTDVESGSNNAMSSGYEGLGKGSANGGASMFLYVVAQGLDPRSQATSHTAAVYRYVVRN